MSGNLRCQCHWRTWCAGATFEHSFFERVRLGHIWKFNDLDSAFKPINGNVVGPSSRATPRMYFLLVNTDIVTRPQGTARIFIERPISIIQYKVLVVGALR